MRRLAAALTLMLGVSSAPAQPETPPVMVSAGSLEVSTQLAAVVARYRFGAAADRVRVTLVTPGGRSDMHSLVVRTVPGEAGLARIDLGSISVEARWGRLRAVHLRDPVSYAETTLNRPDASPADVLRAELPAIPIPQLSLAFDEGEVDWCPLTPGVSWRSAQRLGEGVTSGIRLTGESDVGAISLDIGAGRFRRLEADLAPDGETRLIVESTPIEAGDPATWAVDTSDRRLVAGLDALRAMGPSIRVGSVWPVVTLVASADQPPPDPAEIWTGEGGMVPVIVYGNPVGPEQAARLSLVRDALAHCERELMFGRVDGRYGADARLEPMLGIVAMAESGLTELQHASYLDEWAAVFEGSQGALLRAPLRERLLDRLALGEEMVLALTSTDRRVLAVCPISVDATADSIAQSILDVVPVLPAQPADGSGADGP